VKRAALKTTLGIGLGLFSLSSLAQNDRAGWAKELSFGIIPLEATKESSTRFDPFAKYLERRLGIKIKSYYGADYAAIIVGLESGSVDMAYLGPLSYVIASRRAGAQAFARENTIKTGLGYSSLIVSRADSKIRTLGQAKGKTFAFVDPNSASGYLLPMVHFLKDLNIKPETYFKHVTYSGSHEASIEAVIEGEVSVAATNDREIEIAIRDGEIKSIKDLNILWKSAPIPTAPLAYRKDLPESLKAALKQAVLEFKDKTALEKLGIKNFAAATDSEYNPIRKLEEFKKTLSK
jgi:phosphonate transport system substrate-binding protein